VPDVWSEIAAEIGRQLRPHGFAKRRNRFADASAPEVLKEIVLERFRWNTPGSRKFALTLNVSLAGTLVLTKNVGFLWGDESYLFTVPDASLEPLFDELRLHVERDVVPFCRRCDSVDAVVAVLNELNARLGYPFFSATLAVALARLGRLDEARPYFAEMQGDPESIRTFARTFGITL
jgi:hypothetical protein